MVWRTFLTMGKERRETTRHRCGFTMVWDGPAGFTTCSVVDVSKGGAYVGVPEGVLPAPDQLIDLVPIGAAGDLFFALEGRVVRCEDEDGEELPRGMAVAFVGLDVDDFLALERLFRSATGPHLVAPTGCPGDPEPRSRGGIEPTRTRWLGSGRLWVSRLVPRVARTT